jgi:hypothetical protein
MRGRPAGKGRSPSWAWSAAVLGGHPVAELTANVSELPDLIVPRPLALTTDENGWYRLTD